MEKNAALPRQLCKTRPDLLLTFQTPIQTPSSKRDSRVGREERATFGDAEPILQPFFFRFFIFIYFFFRWRIGGKQFHNCCWPWISWRMLRSRMRLCPSGGYQHGIFAQKAAAPYSLPGRSKHPPHYIYSFYLVVGIPDEHFKLNIFTTLPPCLSTPHLSALLGRLRHLRRGYWQNFRA